MAGLPGARAGNLAAMLVFADQALTTTIVYILVWGVLFPAFVTGLIAYAVVVARGEKLQNDEHRKYPR
jgi:K+-transporting ATPase c subunit